ncbi:MAG: polymerase subunit delta [Clostridiales bacterium]|nr:polymerase subunit delta [Clostridiales bacterium]MDK2933619.1 polymerase subunit delta [Clostridiales bacterium]
MHFKEIIGQRTVIKSLENSIRNHMVSHAYIFEGPEGIGKKTVASIFATALTCKSLQVQPCGVCTSCIKSKSNNHPDIKTIEDNGNHIGVDIVRELQKDIYIKPYESNKKIYIIPRADRMTVQAQNSLLKIFEEPPEYGVMILTTVNASLLLSTILSRAILVRFRIHPYEEIETFLRKEYPELKEEISSLAMLSGGVIGRAKAIASSEEFRDMRQEVVEVITRLLSDSEWDVLNVINYFNDHKHIIELILDFLLLWFRDILFIKELHSESMVINIDMRGKLHEFSRKVSSRAVCNIIDIILDIKKKISMNANYTLAIETMLIKSWEEVHGKGSRCAI